MERNGSFDLSFPLNYFFSRKIHTHWSFIILLLIYSSHHCSSSPSFPKYVHPKTSNFSHHSFYGTDGTLLDIFLRFHNNSQTSFSPSLWMLIFPEVSSLALFSQSLISSLVTPKNPRHYFQVSTIHLHLTTL